MQCCRTYGKGTVRLEEYLDRRDGKDGGGPLATASEARCVATALPRLAIAACCEATGVPPGPRFRVQPG